MKYPIGKKAAILVLVLLFLSGMRSAMAVPPFGPDAAQGPPEQTSGTVSPSRDTLDHQSFNENPMNSYGTFPFVVRLKYLKADQAKTLLSPLVADNRIQVDPLNNALVVIGTEEDRDQINALLVQLDIPPRQVMFEAEVVELSRDNVRNVGVDWGSITALPSAPVSDGSAFRVYLGIPNNPDYGVNLQATIHNLIENKKGRLLASPRIGALDGQTARILIGDKLAVESQQISSGSTITTVNYVDVGIKLEVTPTVNEDNTITTHIVPEVSNKTDTTKSGNPNIRTRQADTTLRVKNGETIVLGGLIQRQETSDTVKFPLLGDIPLVGQFFRSTSREYTETELVILITPKIIDNP